MKSLISVVVCFLFVSTSFTQEIKVKIDNINSGELEVGNQISVNITTSAAIENIAAFQLYIDFDKDVLSYQKTSFVNEKLVSNWMDNNNENFYSANWLIMNSPSSIASGDIICSLQFEYLGGETDIKWQHEQVMKDRYIVKGETVFYNNDSKKIPVEFIDGCVCNHK